MVDLLFRLRLILRVYQAWSLVEAPGVQPRRGDLPAQEPHWGRRTAVCPGGVAAEAVVSSGMTPPGSPARIQSRRIRYCAVGTAPTRESFSLRMTVGSADTPNHPAPSAQS